MRIGCLQFAPQVGDIDNNLNRADAVLAKANPEDLDTLDVLVLPELAFTGYNFKSLQQISPYLEPSGSGISSLWARTTALKYNTNVVVGYPERVDVTPIWPTGPEYYNSAIIVNGDGETVANYRKSFLYSVDEPWALEGKHGFFQGHVRGLGQTAMGICMDLNPYKFEAPWHAFEFGFHILEVRAHLVIVTMAWLTREEPRHFSRMPAEPDMDTLTYWIQRLEPVIRAEDNEEVIVIFCNRTGIEGDAMYAGTSAVVGIKEGEVLVYGILGRGSKEVLVVDTDDPPYAKLVHRPEVDTMGTNSQIGGARSHGAVKTNDAIPRVAEPEIRPSQTLPENSPKEVSKGKPKKERPFPKIEIPEQYYQTTTSTSHKTPVAESPNIPTPTGPSPTPLSARPKLVIPSMRPVGEHIDTPYPRGDEVAVKGRILGGSVSISSDTPITAYSDLDHPTEKFFWLPSQTLLETPMEARWPLPPQGPSLTPISAVPGSPTVPSSLIRYASNDHRPRADTPKSKISSSKSERSSSQSTVSGQSRKSRDSEKVIPAKPTTSNGYAPVRPASPKSRNASRSGRHERRVSEAEKPDIDAMIERLESLRLRTQSAMSQRQDRADTPTHGRPKSPKSRNASRSGRPSDIDFSLIERALNLSRGSIPIGASDSLLGSDILRPRSDILAKDQKLANGSPAQPTSGNHHHSLSDPDRTGSRVEDALRRFDSRSPHIEPLESRTMLWSEISKIVGEHLGRPESQEATRGRQRNTSSASVQARRGSREPPANVRAAPSQTRQGNGEVIRSVRDPSLGPPAHPDDEIVAEIIFRRPGCPTHNTNSRSNSAGGAATPDQSSGSTPSGGNPSRASLDEKSAQGKKAPSPLGNDGNTPSVAKITEQKRNSAPSAFTTNPAAQVSGENLSEVSPPDLAGSSVHTLNSGKTSPSTPSPRAFEPTTPKAMVLGSEYGSLLSTASDPLPNLAFQPLSALVSDPALAKLGRPRSAVW